MIFVDVLIPGGSGEAISFNDEGSPHSHATDHTKIHIDAQVNRALSLDWFYKLLAFFPDVPGELKSGVIVAKFKDLPTETRDRIWRSLSRVRIHIVDPRPHYRKIDNMLRAAWGEDDGPDTLRQKAIEGSYAARSMLARMREMVAEAILQESAAARVQWFGRALSDPFFGMNLPEPLSAFIRSPREPAPLISIEDFGDPGDRNVVRNVASWSAKASAAFHAALDAAMNADDTDVMNYGFGFERAVRKRMTHELLPLHAFDKGNRHHIDLLENSRRCIIDELAANDRFFALLARQKRGFVELESRESYYVQAADFAAGISGDIYASHKLIGVVERFEYVSFNGMRVSRADAENEVKHQPW